MGLYRIAGRPRAHGRAFPRRSRSWSRPRARTTMSTATTDDHADHDEHGGFATGQEETAETPEKEHRGDFAEGQQAGHTSVHDARRGDFAEGQEREAGPRARRRATRLRAGPGPRSRLSDASRHRVGTAARSLRPSTVEACRSAVREFRERRHLSSSFGSPPDLPRDRTSRTEGVQIEEARIDR